MQTSNFFVELIVIGLGALIWVALLALPFLPGEGAERVFDWINTQSSGLLALIFLPLIYLLGILTDRLADRWLARKERHIRTAYFDSDEDVRDVRSSVYAKSEALKDLIEYNRSRLRICRGWYFNTLMLLVGANLYIWIKYSDGRLYASILTTVLLGLFAFLNFYAWRSMTDSEFKKLRAYERSLQRLS